MPASTDPARELAQACEKLSIDSAQAGDAHLALQFGVEPWTEEFFQILFTMTNRINEVCNLVNYLDMDKEEIAEAESHIASLKKAFSKEALSTVWRQNGLQQLSPQRIQALKGVSYVLRKTVNYPNLNETELKEVLILVEQLITLLGSRQLEDRDFIRAALIEGLTAFMFRLNKVSWFGWGYTVESLRAVIGAYFALERAEAPNDPNYEAILDAVKGGLRNLFEKLKTVKESVDITKMALEAYGAYEAVGAAPHAVVKLLVDMTGAAPS